MVSSKHILKISCLLLVLAFALAGCGSDAPEEVVVASVEETPEIAESFTVSFAIFGELHESVVEEGGVPSVPELPEVEGVRFLYWVTESGAIVEPGEEPAVMDMKYAAVYAPVLDRHVPYLHTDDSGLLHPDDTLDNTELVAALCALAGEAAKAHFPELPETGGAVTVTALWETLRNFYTESELNPMFGDLPGEQNVTKSRFARIMNALLGRNSTEGVVISEDALFIPDLPRSRSDYAELMEAVIAHGHLEDEGGWQEARLGARYAEGFNLIDGSLCCVDTEGFFICDTVIGTLTFGYDGKYTSGDATLDSYVSGVLGDICYAHPGADREELLRAAYNYTRDGFSYLRRNIYNIGHTGWEVSDALTMFESLRGNCYSYTAVFWSLARGLGYDAVAVSGTIGRDYEPHAWVEIDFDGTTYYFDPETEMAYNRDGVFSKDMFKMPWVYASGWFYYKG